MLVLTRKLMERLYIGEDICITLVRIEGGQVRLGIDAPRHVPVVRSELVEGQPGPATAHVGGVSGSRSGARASVSPEIDSRRRERSRSTPNRRRASSAGS